MFDWCHDANFFQRTVAIFVLMVAADTADRSCEVQQRMIDQVLCISRRMLSLLISLMSPAGSFCPVIPVLHDCSLYNLLGAAIPGLADRNCSRLKQS
jgi:hypothetical protein